MHPEMLRELTDQRGREMRARARQGSAGPAGDPGRAPRALPAGRGRRVRLPAIPDYVDGSFRPGPASTAPTSTALASTGPAAEAVASEAGQAPATHHAA